MDIKLADENLRKMREALGLTVPAAAAEMNLSAATLARYEKGAFVKFEKLWPAARFYGVYLADLISENCLNTFYDVLDNPQRHRQG